MHFGLLSPCYLQLLTSYQGYLGNKAYIVTQGPLPDTRRDFLKMLFDRNVSAIVMLTETEEEEQV